jgi:two-component system, OmpR family, response regulator MtrA
MGLAGLRYPHQAMLDVLLVEDDPALRDVMAFHLQAEGWTVRAVSDGEAGLAACDERLPEVAVLDVMLPGMSGLEVCTALRARYSPSPGVIMVTARSSEADVLCGFDSGADDYVVKPFRPRILCARVAALSRRVSTAGPAQTSISVGTLRIDPGAKRAEVGGQTVKLTATEYALLEHLARHPAKVFSRLDLLRAVWDTSHEGYARTVDCHVTRLRRKLEAAGLAPMPIQTVQGFGYVLAPA